MKIVTLANLKGGSGKTSGAVPLAYWASRRHKTAVVDLDASESATQWIEAAHLASTMLGLYTIRIQDLKHTLGELEEAGFEYVFLDTPSFVEATVMRCMAVADLVAIPVHIGTGDIGQLPRTLDLLELPMQANPDLKVVAYVNHGGTMKRVEQETHLALEELSKRYPFSVMRFGIPMRTIYATAKGRVPDGWHYQQLWNDLQARMEGKALGEFVMPGPEHGDLNA